MRREGHGKLPFLAISAVAGEGLKPLIAWVRAALEGLDERDALFRDLALNVLGQALEQ